MKRLPWRQCVIMGMSVIVLAHVLAPWANAETVRVDVDAQGKRIQVSPDLYGVFYEEINHAGDGGLYAEMVQNRSFEENEMSDHMHLENGKVRTDKGWETIWKPKTDLRGWFVVAQGGADVAIALDDTRPLNAQSPHALRVELKQAGARAGFANEGYWGMSVVKGENYHLSFYARSDKKSPVTITLESQDGQTVYARKRVRGVGGPWKRYRCVLTAKDTDPKARLAICLRKPATLWFDMVSLFPENTYKQRIPGMRADLMGKLHELRPKFLRFPGGCVVEGCTLDNRIQWKETIGDIAQRPGHWDLWGYRASDGLGFHEFLQMAEDLDAEVMYVVNVGMSCQARHSETASEQEIVDIYLQDTLDALEYAMGPASSKWGALRVQNGHPEPFKVKYVEIGNENSGADYHRAYRIFYRALKATYPTILTIANQAIPDAPVEIIDEHYYVGPHWFFAHANKYDGYDRTGPKIYVGEYAVNRGVGSGNLMGALSEAAFMLGMERNSDHVIMASYAPLFENVNDREWDVNLIRFNSSRVLGRSSFYVQKMFAEHLPTVMCETAVSNLEAPAPIEPRGRIGLRTWLTDAEFKDLRVTQGDRVLYASAFSQGSADWNSERGTWETQKDAYRQTDPLATDTLTVVGDTSWSDYTLELKAKRNRGAEGFIIVFRHQDNSHVQWNLGGWGNSRHTVQLVADNSASVVTSKDGAIEKGRWYDIRIVLQGNQVSCFLDGELIHRTDVTIREAPNFFANAGVDETTGEVIVKLVNARTQGRDVRLSLKGFGDLDKTVSVITLHGDRPEDENSFAHPLKISPVTSTFTQAGKAFGYTLKPLSVTILRMKGL
ncbi:alpha-L-arabinofuranosidase C-terminal domain-containing protein [Novipirellula artificiosorum]|uniref:non-reducing end alpha-L-arabinofuranosidase n=1 Tax=Novipirellula artificiosorum TaxID=2528016 RepID=A0A5C6DMQ1_9BACT|nr:alpha-L-arabinofuranosidase C-terminal domain-containing protein [Novipirellula artificiosorum]TWU37434.1 Extracellular exo-alpha-L-arabinofuranosidase precursor [Novipirellula artificiosorum]